MCVRAMKGGAVDFLQKPVDDEDLLTAISTALEQDYRTRDSQRQRAELHQRVTTLTPRERDVMGLITTGLLNKEIAYDLGTSEKTIKAHRARVMRKMQATSIAALVRMVATVEVSESQTTSRLHSSSWGAAMCSLTAAQETSASVCHPYAIIARRAERSG